MKPTSLLPFVLASILTLANKSLALPEQSSVHPVDHPVSGTYYRWLIGEEEASRISELIDHDIREIDFLGFNMNSLPRPCAHCGKQTEVVDWFYTALGRGVHSKEWIIQGLREGRISQKNAHDVYCSRCGHLTEFRDSSGDEGWAPHISQATTYDHTSKTFQPAGWKRGEAELPKVDTVDQDTAVGESNEVEPSWYGTDLYWAVRRADIEVDHATEVGESTEEEPSWFGTDLYWAVRRADL